MIVGTGVDIVEVGRIQASMEKEAFKMLVFSVEEQTYCDKQVRPYQHYAARFAAKESFLKAIGKGLQAGFSLRDIEVVSDGIHAPSIRLHGNFAKLADEERWTSMHVSLSHVDNYAMAQVIIEK